MTYRALDTVARDALRYYRQCVRITGQHSEESLEAYIMCIEAGVPEGSPRLTRMSRRTGE